MTDFIKKILKTEGMLYIIVGCLTTVVNFVVFQGFTLGLTRSGLSSSLSGKIAYVIAFIVAVIFAYWTNKFYVFKNNDMRLSHLKKEFIGFASARIISGVMTFILYAVLVDFFSFHHTLAWLSTTVINLVFNYVASKFWIFKGER